MKGFLSDTGSSLKIEHSLQLSVMRHTHVHPQYELYFCPHKVTQTAVINGEERTYRYPCAILSTPFTVHSMSCDDLEAKQYERYVFYFGENILSSFAPHLLPFSISEQNGGFLFPLTEGQGAYLKKMLDLCASSSYAEQELLFVLFLNKLLAFCPETNAVRFGGTSSYVRDILQTISENFATFLDADELAGRFAVSRSKLDRDFKHFTGVTVYRFVELCRLNHAKYLLCHKKDLSVGEIALQCGFDGETSFFPFFKKHTGQTPTNFRNQPYTIQKNDIIFELNRGCGDE